MKKARFLSHLRGVMASVSLQPATSQVVYGWALALIMVVAFIVRVWGINFGLPYLYNPDEGKLIYTAFYAASQKGRPDTFIHSTLVSYLLIPIYGAYFMLGKLLGFFSSPFQFYVAYLTEPTPFVLIGRMLMVLFSLGCVWLTFLIGRRFYGEKVGLLGAFFLSLSFLFVKESHYVKDEVSAAFFLLGYFYFLLLTVFPIPTPGVRRRRNTTPGVRNYLWAGFFLGLSVSAKYIYAPVFLLLPLVTFSFLPPRRRAFPSTTLGTGQGAHSRCVFLLENIRRAWFDNPLRGVLGACTLAFLTFLVTNPYIIIDFPRFYVQTKELFLTQRMIGTSLIGGRPTWLNFLTKHLPEGMGWPLFLASVLGILSKLGGSGRLGRLERRKDLLLALFIFLLFTGVILGGGNFPRWAVPLFPFLCLAAAIFVCRLVGVFSGLRENFWLALIALVLVWPSLLRVVKFNHLLGWPDTRTIAKNWIEANISPGTRIAIEGTASDEIPSYLGPALRLSQARLEEKLEEAERAGQEGQNLQAVIKAYQGRIGYDLVGVPRLDRKRRVIGEMRGNEKREVICLISSSWVYREGIGPREEFLDFLKDDYNLVKEFRPTVVMENEPHAWRMDYQALDQVPLFQKGIFGPVVKVYGLKEKMEER